MKKHIIFIIFIAVINIASASSIEVPAQVLKSFEEHYPHAENVCWAKSGDEYIADFYLHKHEAKVLFNNAGAIDEVDVLVNWKDLPKDIKMFVYKNFGVFAVQECDVIEHFGHEDGYGVVMMSQGMKYHLYFNHQHTLIKTTCTVN